MTKIYATRSQESLKQIAVIGTAQLAPRLPDRERAEAKRPQRVGRAILATQRFIAVLSLPVKRGRGGAAFIAVPLRFQATSG